MAAELSDFEAARIFKTMGDPVRLGILRRLSRGEQPVGDLANALGLSMARVSHHLAILRAEGLVADRRSGKQVFYTSRLLETGYTALLTPMGLGVQEPATPALRVLAASDLSLAFRAVGEAFQEQTGIMVRFRFGATHALGRELSQDPAADLFASASREAIATLAEQDLIDPRTIMSFARGSLALWCRNVLPYPVRELGDLLRPEVRWVVIPNPEVAPNGAVAAELLRRDGLWDAVRPKLLLSNDAQQALHFADTDNDAVAIVPLALCAGTAGRYLVIPEHRHLPLDHTLALTRSTQHPVQARAFSAFVSSPPGRDILQRYGFAVA
ncbi:Molybdate-binding periplasmic protein precursor [compost metagenome]